MRKKKTSTRELLGKPVDRRQALKGLGAFAVAAPAFAAISCGGNESGGNGATGGTTGGSGTTGGATATGGASPTITGGSSSSPATGGSSAMQQGTGGSATGGNSSTGGNPGTGGSSSQTGGQGAGGGSTQSGGDNAGGKSGGGQGGKAGGQSTGGQGDGGKASGGQSGGGKANGGQANGGQSSGGQTGSGGSGGALTPPNFDNVASCTLTPTDRAGEGPFMLHDDEVQTDVSLIRQDMRDGKEGVELQLHLRLLDQSKECATPISDVEVYIWHTDASGFYSGFNNQNPDMTYSGAAERTPENMDRFCRGVQVTNSDGVVSFRTVFPGWYNGRAIHIHFVALRKGSKADTSSYRSTQYMVFTTQMYFDEQFSRDIHENNAPYNKRASGANYDRYVKPETNVRPTVKKQGDVVVGALNILTSSAGSRR